MSHRQPRMSDQARALRENLASKGIEFGQSECFELVAKLNGFPSWNVAKQVDKAPPRASGTTLKFELWPAVHHHRHGQDLFFFSHCPSEDEVIARIEAASSWEPDADESIEIRAVETFDIDVPLTLARAARPKSPKLVSVYEVCMTDFFDYDVPESRPEWRWIEANASFGHKGNGVEGGVWEFMVHVETLKLGDVEVPGLLKPHVQRALELEATWLMFHQG